ncbi:MAG: xanthine dehydrogenase accessory factor [Gaiellaceae bacterium]|nr:xanthine dehydrogenase accessory factor [Gaiellaceae bacterium]
MKEILDDIERFRARGERFAIATVIATRRSAPRPLGSKLVVSAGGELAGSVSGGCVEGDVFGHACEVLEGSRPQLLSYGIADELAFSVGLPCGGEIDVFVEEPDSALLERVLQVVETEERAVLFTIVEGEPLGAELLVTEAGESVGAGPPELADHVDEILRRGRNTLLELGETKVFAEVYGPAPRIVVIGAVDTAEALCRSAKAIGWHTIVADARGKFATRERIPSADELIVEWPDEALTQVAPDYQTAVVVLTHDDKFDIPALKHALGTEAFYVGALGSRRNQERRRERLLEEGVDEAQLQRISGPCGLDIGADTPSETAVSILGEILAVRARRDGGRLQTAKGRIHVEPTTEPEPTRT